MTDPQDNIPRPKSTRASWTTWLTLVAIIGLVAFPVISSWSYLERERWIAAAAYEKYEEGHRGEAIELLSNVVANSRENKFLKVKLAEWSLNEGQPEKAIQLCDELLTGLATDPTQIEQAQLLDLRTIGDIKFQALLQLGKNEQALDLVKFMEQAFERFGSQQKSIVNDFSYFRSLAKLELDVAYTRMSDMLETQNKIQLGQFEQVYSYRVKVLVACGLLALDLKSINPALTRISEEIVRLENSYDASKQNLFLEIYSRIEESMPWIDVSESGFESLRFDADANRRELAVLLAIRALLFEGKDLIEESKRDRLRLKELQVNEADLLSKLPSHQECLAIASEGGMYLDTLGWIQFQRNNLLGAFLATDLAVVAIELEWKARDSSKLMAAFPSATWQVNEALMKKSLATLLKHRYLIQSKRKETRASETDRRRILELGFDVNDPQLN